MKKSVIFILLALLLLVACGGTKTTGKRVAIPDSGSPVTGMVTGSSDSSSNANPPAATETAKTAAEVLDQMKTVGGSGPATDTAPKSGNFYPPIRVNGTGKAALAEKTRALFSQNLTEPNVKADTTTGMNGGKYHNRNGDVVNLPKKYTSG